MTILATTMACAFLIVLASVGFGIQKSITEEIKSQQVITEVTVFGKAETEPGESQLLSNQDLEELADVKNVTAVVRRNTIDMEAEVAVDDRTGITYPIYITNMEQELKANLSLSKGAIPKEENEVIVGYHFAQALLTKKEREEYEKKQEATPEGELIEEPVGFEGDLIGKELTVNVTKITDEEEKEDKSFSFIISGIGKEPSRDWETDQSIYINDSLREEILEFTYINEEETQVEEIPYSQVLVYATSLEKVEQVTNDLKDKGYNVFSITEELDSVNLFFTVFKAGLVFVGTIAIIIASIGIFNTMTMAVTERTQEIGIMKALGAQPGTIRRIFLMESAYIGVMGAIIGVAISYAISFAANMLLPIILSTALGSEDSSIDFVFSYIPFSLVLIASAISIGVAMISGFRPAAKATNINVLSALRREM